MSPGSNHRPVFLLQRFSKRATRDVFFGLVKQVNVSGQPTHEVVRMLGTHPDLAAKLKHIFDIEGFAGLDRELHRRRLGFVYVLKMKSQPRYYKIGQSISPERRVRELTKLPFVVKVWHKIATDRPDELEKAIQKALAHMRRRGEWFQPSPEVLNWLKQRESITGAVKKKVAPLREVARVKHVEVAVDLPADLVARLKERAQSKSTSPGKLIRRLVEKALEEQTRSS